MTAFLDRFFKVSASGSTLTTECRAAVTTFLAMSYILFVNPQILAQAITLPGYNASVQLLSATAISAAIGCFLMGFWAHYPIAVAPGMGLNAYFVFSVVLERGIAWRTALGAVFVSGIVFLMLSLSGLREAVINGIPVSLKRAVSAGIGMFLAFIGLSSSGFVITKQNTLVGIGDVMSAPVLLMLGGLILAVVLLIRRVPGALLISMVTCSLAAIVLKLPVYSGKPFAGFTGSPVGIPVLPVDLFGQMNLSDAMQFDMLGIVFTFLFVAFFDTAGTLIGLAERAGLTDPEGRIPRASQVFTTDAVATSIGALLGTSTTTAYVESAAGMEEGGKTGLVAVVVGILFLLSLFFWPVVSMVPAAATAPALIILGAMMMEAAAKIDWRDYRDSIPAFLTLLVIPLTWSISTGVALGVISYVLIRCLAQRGRDVHPIMFGLAIILAVKMIIAGG